jgi:hypothetical protein
LYLQQSVCQDVAEGAHGFLQFRMQHTGRLAIRFDLLDQGHQHRRRLENHLEHHPRE